MWLLECSKNSWVKTCKTGDQAYSDTSSNDGRVLSCIVQSYARKSRSKHDLSLQIFQLGSFYFNEPVLFLTCLAQVGVVFAIPLYAQYPVQIDLKGGKAYGIDIIVRLTFASH